MNNQYFSELNGYLVKDKKINDMLNDELKVNYLSIGNTPVSGTDERHLGDCIVITGEKNGIIDFGFQNDCNHLIDFLNDNNISKIDFIIITHYHADHIGGNGATGLSAVLNSGIDFSDCTVYLPHKNIDWSQFTGTTFETAETTVKNLLNTKGIPFVYPNNEDIINLTDNISLTFYNIGSSFYNDYYDEFTNWNLMTSTSTIYNNFSMMILMKHYNNKFLFTGDIEPLAQSKLYHYVKDIDVLKVEHHGLNYNVNTDYVNQLNPKYAIVTELDDLTSNELIHEAIVKLKDKGCSVYRTTKSGDVTVTSKYNKIDVNALEKYDLYSVNYSLFEGTPIPENADLNDYVNPGIYNSYNQTRTGTLLHCPFTGAGFKLIVERHNYSIESVRQTILKNNVDGAIYVRNIIGGVYGNWNKLSNGIDFDLDSSSFTPGSFDITYTTTNNETRYQCRNNVCSLSLTFKANEDITTGTTILTLPSTITINGESRTITYPNQITTFNMETNAGVVYPMYLGGGNQLRTRLQIPSGTTVRGNVTFII